MEDSAIEAPDAYGESAVLTRRFMPRAVLWKGELSEAASRYGKKTANARYVGLDARFP